MQAEADLFLIFTGWTAQTTESMSIEELMRWHKIAMARHEAGKAGQS